MSNTDWKEIIDLIQYDELAESMYTQTYVRNCQNYSFKIFINRLSISEFFENMGKQRMLNYFPKTEDLLGAALGLVRLQRTYKLRTSDLADGQIKNKKLK